VREFENSSGDICAELNAEVAKGGAEARPAVVRFQAAVEREESILTSLISSGEACEKLRRRGDGDGRPLMTTAPDRDATSEVNGAATADAGALPGCDELTPDRVVQYQSKLSRLGQCTDAAKAAAVDEAAKLTDTELCRALSGYLPDMLGAACDVSTASLVRGGLAGGSQLCAYVGKLAGNNDACAESFIKNTCAGISAGTIMLVEIENNAVLSQEEQTDAEGRKILRVGARAFADKINGCIAAAVKAGLKKQLVEAAVDTAAKQAVAGATSSLGAAIAQGDKLLGDPRTKVALLACQAVAGGLAAATQTDGYKVDFDNACGAVFGGDRSRAAACFKSVESGCGALVGKIDVSKTLGITDEQALARAGAEIANSGLLAACSVGGNVSSAACGVISAAAEQIKTALVTGNNDWAHCVGTDQMGACVGTMYADWRSGGWSNKNGVEDAERTANGDAYRGCCWCYKETYVNDKTWPNADTLLTKENWFGVIQKGDIRSGNCAVMETKGYQYGGVASYVNGYQEYWRYTDCGKWYVRGTDCGADGRGKVEVWSPTQKRYVPVANVVPY
jgi:hypothetical protein